MKTWQKILIIILAAAALLAAGIRLIYTQYISPRFIAPSIDKISQVVNDRTVQTEINKLINELRRDGYIQDEQISDYLELAENLGLQTDPEGDQNATLPTPESTRPAEPKNAPQSGSGQTPDWNQDYAQGSGAHKNDQQPEKTSAPVKTKEQSLEEKVLSAMTASEVAFARRIEGKVDVSKAMSLLNSDEEALKEYIKSVLTSDEISQCISLYAKYAYILQEEGYL